MSFCKMKTKMAEGSEYFSIGSIVSCKTCYDQKTEGEVLAFDPQTKMLILKCTASNVNEKGSLHNVHILNLNQVGNVEVKKEVNTSPPPLQNLNYARLMKRANRQVEEKMKKLSAMSAGATPEGTKLFLAIRKTLEEVSWSGKNIVVLNQVTITPPYRPENCKGEGDACTHVKKIVEKHLRDQENQLKSTEEVNNKA